MSDNNKRPVDDWEGKGNVFADMAAFDRKYGFNEVRMTPAFLGFRMRFLIEEVVEALEAIDDNCPEAFVDAMIDVIVIAAGTLSIGRVDSQRAWDEVRRANMSKVRGENPTRTGSGGADLVKPQGWEAPDHTENVGDFHRISGMEFEQHFPHSIRVLFEAMAMQFAKHQDYNTTVVQRAEYWIHGIDDLAYEINKKVQRLRSVLEHKRQGRNPNFESEEDSLLDSINYHSFGVSLLRKREPGQSLWRDVFNRQETEDERNTELADSQERGSNGNGEGEPVEEHEAGATSALGPSPFGT